MEAQDRYDGLPRSLSAASFTILGRQFAAHSAACGALTWAWIDAASIDGGPFGSPPTGYLRASPLLLQTPERGHDAAMAAALDNADDDPSLAAPILSQAPRLLLQIVHNTTYNVPVLLLQGYHAEGSLWSPDELRAHLTAIPGVAPPLTRHALVLDRRRPERRGEDNAGHSGCRGARSGRGPVRDSRG